MSSTVARVNYSSIKGKYIVEAHTLFKAHNQLFGIITSSSSVLLHLIVFLVGLLSQEAGLLQLVLQRVHALLIGQRTVLQHLAGAIQ